MRFGAIVIVFLIVAVAIGVWYSTRTGPEQELETLAAGERALILPLMTYYSLPAYGPRGTSETTVTFGNTTFIDFTWGNLSGADLPVRFVFRPNASFGVSFESGPADGFRLRPVYEGLTVSFGSSVGGSEAVYARLCVLNYTAKRMARTVGFGSESWIQVEYTLSSSMGILADLPYANVTSPDTSDLLLAANEVVDLQGPWTYERSLSNFTQPSMPFRYRVGQVVFPLGTSGNLTVDLTSSFAWGPDDGYGVLLTGRQGTTLNVTWYWDQRFGSLLAM